MADVEDALRIYDMSITILETVNSVFEQYGVELPQRQYVSMGETVHECEQVTVTFEQLYTGPPGIQDAVPTRCDGPKTGLFTVEVVRCVPTPSVNKRTGGIVFPEPEKQNAGARVQSMDAWLLLEAGLTVGQQQTTYTNQGVIGGGAIADVAAGPVSGDYQAMVLNLTLAV